MVLQTSYLSTLISTQKVCYTCKKEKQIKEFICVLHHKDKLSSSCKECIQLYKSIYYLNNKEHIKNRINTNRKNEPWKHVWQNINKRCNNIKNDNYKYYGGRGIKNSFKNWDEIKFLWIRDNASKMYWPSIDRINNNGNYCLENCRFIEMIKNISKKGRTIK